MPRPNLPSKRPGARQSQNPFTNWRENMKARRTEPENEASQIIANQIAGKENAIVAKLGAIDFDKSKLPRKLLEYKTDPSQTYGDLENDTLAIIEMIQKNPRAIKTDIRKLDEKILVLVQLFEEAVAQGDAEAAYTAKAGIVRAIQDIRSRIPQAQPELARQFVESNDRYLDYWVTLVQQAKIVDGIKRSVENLKLLHDEAVEEQEMALAKIKDMLENDVDVQEAAQRLYERNSTADRAHWSDAERKVHSTLVEYKLDTVRLDLQNFALQQEEEHLRTTKAQMDVLFVEAARVPINLDPDQLNKFSECVDDMFKHMNETQEEINRVLQTMDYIEGNLKQLDSNPGSLRAKEYALEGLNQALGDMKKKQAIESGEAKVCNRKWLDSQGIKSEEQIALDRKRNEELLRERMQEQIRELEEVEIENRELILSE